MTDSLGMQITKLLLRERPGLLVCDLPANAEACGALAAILGSLMATVKEKKGQAYYEMAARAVFKKIDDAAKDVHARAQHEAAHNPPSSH